MEAKEVKNLKEVVGWWGSEKYDGHKGRWDGLRMWSRNGTQCHPIVYRYNLYFILLEKKCQQYFFCRF